MKRFEKIAHMLTMWDQIWIPATIAVIMFLVGLATLDVTWIVLSLVGGFGAFLAWAVWTHIDS